MAGDEKTEKATPKKKRDERKKGNTFSSKDLASALFLFIVFYSIRILGKFMLQSITQGMYDSFTLIQTDVSIDSRFLQILFASGAKTVLFVVGPILLISSAATILFTGAQTRFLFAPDALKPKFQRINPISGIKKLFSIRSVVELFKGLLKIAIIVYVIYGELKGRMHEFSRLLDMEPLQSFLYTMDAILSLVTSVGIFFLLISVGDYIYQWWEYEKNLKMSKQEIKEEYKQMEGDPQIRSQIKQRQREMSQRRMMQEVPTADVIIRNPTHYAVAIRYEAEKSHAPVVVAKGADEVAKRILRIAEEHGVPMQENRILARALYEGVELDKEIPPEFYRAVAEVLAVIYELKQRSI